MDVRRLGLYIGGMLGPFGTIVTVPMVPELRDEFSVSTTAVGWTFTAYLIPFALLLVVSGTLGERWGRRRTIRLTMVTYAVASVLCALAPGFGWLLLGRGVQGAANAFITPLLVASLAEITPPELLGRTLGVYSSFQAVGSGGAPILGGLAADMDWRLAFWGVAIVAAALAFIPPPASTVPPTAAPPARGLFTRPVNLLGLAFFAGAAGPIGAAVIVGVAARDELGLSGSAAGFVLLAYAASGALTGPMMGRVMDRTGGRMLASVGLVASGIGVMLLAVALDVGVAAIVVLWLLTGIVGNAAVLSFHAIGAGAIPGNRGGGVSMMLAYRFLGHAVGPLIFLPVFGASPSAAFVGAGALGLLGVFVLHASGLDTDRSVKLAAGDDTQR